MTTDNNFFLTLPKAELHCHLDGSIRLTTLIELAKEQDVKLPSYDPTALKNIIGFGKIHPNLDDYLSMFNFTLSVMQTESALHRIAYELMEDAAKENIWHIEIRFCPTYFTYKGLSLHQAIKAIKTGCQAAKQKYNTSFTLILCAIRTLSEKENLTIIETAVENQTAVDLAGSEHHYQNQHYQNIFSLAHQHKLDITIHAGEDFSYKNIEHALQNCHAQRIGHGTHLFQNETLLQEIIEKQIPLEVCPTSNLQTHAIRNLKNHPAKEYLKKGVKITLNTDNRLMSDTTLSKEYEITYQNFNLDIKDIKTLVLNSFEAAFLPYEQKQILIKEAKKEIPRYFEVFV